jgi:hypothetical protein
VSSKIGSLQNSQLQRTPDTGYQCHRHRLSPGSSAPASPGCSVPGCSAPDSSASGPDRSTPAALSPAALSPAASPPAVPPPAPVALPWLLRLRPWPRRHLPSRRGQARAHTRRRGMGENGCSCLCSISGSPDSRGQEWVSSIGRPLERFSPATVVI